jgi:hypothetical protein
MDQGVIGLQLGGRQPGTRQADVSPCDAAPRQQVEVRDRRSEQQPRFCGLVARKEAAWLVAAAR